MHSVNLLVIDRSPESAEHVNSLLRNSGIKIHVIHTQTGKDVKRALDHESPVLIIYADAEEADASLEEISALASAFNVPLALFTNLENPERLAESLANTACFVINSKREDLLTDAVNKLVRNSENERQQENQQQHLEELEHRYNLLLDSSRDPIAYVHEGLHVYANRAYLESLRVEEESGLAGLSLLEMLEAEDLDFKSLFKGISKGVFPTQAVDVKVKRPDGSVFDASLLFSPARYDGEDCTQMMMQRRDAANELAAELEHMRVTDPLTQLHNRKAFTDALDERIASSPSENANSVFYIEPDGFEELLNELDADSIDAFMIDLANVIRGCISEGDFAARVNDHGFAVLAQRSSAAELEAAAQGVLSAYRSHVIEIGDRAFSSSCSIGMSDVGRLDQNSADALMHARMAQTEAAQSGDQLVVYRPQLTAVESLDGEQEWVDRIKFALGNQDVYTVQQPIVDLDGEGDQLMENIVHLRGEDGDHSSAEFLAIAERNELGGTIDRHFIPSLLKTFVDSDERQVINLSSNSILDYGFPGWFATQMNAACVEGKKVILQIAASDAHTNLRPAQRLMKELNPLGCQLAICHFDAERRTRQLLDHLEISFVKLDTSLTRDLTANTKNQESIRKIVEAAEPFDVAVIAEEVADTSSLAVLWQCGVKLISGAFLKESSQVLAQ